MKIEKIKIIGAGTAGLLTVYSLAQEFPDKKFYWIFPEKNETIGVGEATVPYVLNFLKKYGISFKNIFYDLNGSLKLGIKFIDFYKHETYHPFGNNFNESQLLLYFIKKNKIPINILSYSDIAVHFNTKDLFKFLFDKIKLLNNVVIERRYFSEKDIEKNSLIIDATGFKRIIINKYTKLITDERILNDTALIFKLPQQNLEFFSTFQRIKEGWLWKIPLHNYNSFGYVFSSKIYDSNKIINYIENKFQTNVKKISFYSGRNEKQLIKTDNVLFASVGLSSFFIEPLESTGLYFVTYFLNLLIDFLKNKISLDNVNQKFNSEYDATKEFILAHFINSPYFPSYKKFTFKKIKNEIFPEQSWNYILNPEASKKLQLSISEIKKIKNLISPENFLKVKNEKYFNTW